LTVKRSGKAEAVLKAIKRFKIEQNYLWVHVADSDSVFGENYFNIYKKALKGKKYVVAVGFVQSLRGNWIAHYRSFTYTYSQHIIRRFQSWFNMIAVFHGPITSFKTSIIKDLDFKNHSLTEDFDLSLQVHRKKLGKIRYIPEAINYTQDPRNLKDFCDQTARWQRGFFQGVTKYKIGRRLQPIDISIGYQMIELCIYIFQIFFVVPYVIITTHSFIIIPLIIVSDLFVVSLLAIMSSIAIGRISPISSLPYYYFLRWIELGIFLKSFYEVVILKKYQSVKKGWATEKRRFKLDANALRDVAK
jgi:cellulose synthase/poly-beta-1,6-N-acetylglucosamine synthase-like glycosyltransferase